MWQHGWMSLFDEGGLMDSMPLSLAREQKALNHSIVLKMWLSCARWAVCVWWWWWLYVISINNLSNVCQQCDRWSTQVSARRSAVLPEALLMWTAGTQQVLPQQVPYRIHVWSQMLGTKTLWGMLNPDRWRHFEFWVAVGTVKQPAGAQARWLCLLIFYLSALPGPIGIWWISWDWDIGLGLGD